jgi:predicted site-specific integrase-resolvase
LPAKRTITNRRYYTDEERAAALQHKLRAIIAYCRVSSQAQKPDLQNQQAALEQLCRRQVVEVDEWVLEVGGGLNFDRQQFLRLVLAHQDCLVRFGYQLLAHLFQTHQTEFVVMSTETLSPEHRTPDTDQPDA